MGYNFRPVERDQQYLMPASLRDWLPDDDLAWLVLDAVDEMDLGSIYARYRTDGWGAPAFDPAMMTALLLYAYATGERSSRRIEQRCRRDVAYRVICANQTPDHATIARFRVDHEAALGHLFGEILRLCAAAGLGNLLARFSSGRGGLDVPWAVLPSGVSNPGRGSSASGGREIGVIYMGGEALRSKASRLCALAVAVGATALMLTAGGAMAHPAQHGMPSGHLLGTGAFGNIEFVSKAVVTSTPDLVADVTVNPAGTYAFLANWGEECTVSESGGVNIPDAGAWIIDIRDLTNPKKVGFIPSHQDSRPGEGMQVVNITTSAFSGDVLVMNNEQYCTSVKTQGKGGVSLFDVSNPLKPVKLAENWGDRGQADVNDIHSAFAWDAGPKAYVVIVDNFEFPDVDILDITNPKRPRLIAEYDLNMFGVDQPEIGLTNSFIHDMIVKKIGDRFVMLVSYWDGGYVQLDVTNPANAVFLGDTDYAAVDPLLKERTGIELTPEGNGHQAEFTLDNRYFIATDEDFDAYRATEFTITSGTFAGSTHQTAPTGGGAPVTLLPDKKLNGPVVNGGYGCPVGSAAIPPRSSVFPAGSLAPGEEAIVVLQRGPTGDPSATEPACFPGEKAAMGKAAGYDAVVLVARHLGDPEPLPPFCGSGAFPAEPIVTLCTTHTAYHNMFNMTPDFSLPYVASKEPALGQVGERIEVGSIFDGWGYVHLFDANSFADLDQFAVPQAHDPAFAIGFGDLSVHEVATDPDEANRAYLSYYAGGIRALQITKKKELVETGGYLDPNGNDFWGVETFIRNGQTIILGSDRDSGLWIFRQKS